jgi:HK97 family phage major capsid protein
MALPDIAELQEQLSHKIHSAADISDTVEKEGRTFTQEEIDTCDRLKSEAEGLRTQIEQIERDKQLHARMKADRESLTKPRGPSVLPAQPEQQRAEPQRPTIEFPHYRVQNLRAFRPIGGESKQDAEMRAYQTGQYLLAVFKGSEKARTWCMNNMPEGRALSVGTNTAGGVMVPEGMEASLINLREDYGIFRQNTRVLPMGTDTMTIPRITTHPTIYFPGEGTAPTAESTTAYDNVRLTAKKMMGYSLFSSELDEDAVISIGDIITNELALAFATKEDECGFNGDGSDTYAGIIGVTVEIVDGTHTAGAVDATAGHDTMAEIDAADITGMMGACPVYARRNAKFYCSHVFHSAVFERLAISAGGNTVASTSEGFQPRYLGYPIVLSPSLETSTGTVNDTPYCLFGDLTMASTMGERRGFTIATSTEYKWAEDQIAIKATERFDINVHDLGDTSNAGPIVALIGCTS